MGGWDAPWHWIIIALVVIALFGYKRLPDAAHSLGRSLRLFRREINGTFEEAQASSGEPHSPMPRELSRAETVCNETIDGSHQEPRARPRPTPAA